MSHIKHAAWLAALTICSGHFGIVRADEAVEARLQAETKLLFQAVLAEQPLTQRCELEAAWRKGPIPEQAAREIFGLKVHAGLSAPVSTVHLQDVVVLGVDEEEFICDPDRAKVVEDEQIKRFEQGTEEFLHISRASVSFPVFSDNYELAALIISHTGQGLARTADGVHPLAADAEGHVAVFRKMNGAWRQVKTIVLYVS